MALDDLLRAAAARGGQAQSERDDPRLDPGAAPLDPRHEGALLALARTLAGQVRLAGAAEDGATWQAFFPEGDAETLAALARRDDGEAPPHLALWQALLRLYRQPQALLNGLTAQHLDHQMRQRLGFAPQPARPEHAHVLLALKKAAAPLLCGPEHRFSGGRDAQGRERLYRPLRSTPIGPVQVQGLMGLHRDGGRLRAAPQADSADGLGAPLSLAVPHFAPGGPAEAPEAPLGFAVSSPLLRLAEGRREIQLVLGLVARPTAFGATDLAGTLEGWLSGPKGWIGPLPVQGQDSADGWQLNLPLGPDRPAVVDHLGTTHGQPFPDGLPVLQLLLRPGAELRPGRPAWSGLEGLRLATLRLRVAVSGLRPQALENDHGALDPKKAFMPFGAQPVPGSTLRVSCPEALAKPLHSLSLHLDWHAAPPSLGSWYAHYRGQAAISGGVGAQLALVDGAGHPSTLETRLQPRAGGRSTLDTHPGRPVWPQQPGWLQQGLLASGSAKARGRAEQHRRARPVLHLPPAFGTAPPQLPPGQLSLSLVGEDFLHTAWRQEAVPHLLAQLAKAVADRLPPLNEPYTPQCSAISLDYVAEDAPCVLDAPDEAAFKASSSAFFQVDAFGPVREHAWLRAGLPWAPQGAPGLLASHPDALELCIGLAGLRPGDAVSLLCQVAEGTADPAAAPPRIDWSVLCDTQWRPLGPAELALDTSAHLRHSGLLQCTLPADASTAHTRLPAGRHWLRAVWRTPPGSAARLLQVAANGVELVALDDSLDPQRFAQPLPAGSIARLVTPIAAVQAVQQPFAGFGGAAPEAAAALRRRAAERLRHRDRAISPWDVERLVLQAFPAVQRVQCVPHARPGGHWLAPGHRLVVVVADARHAASSAALQPRLDLDTLQAIQALLDARSAPGTRTHVVNPGYRAVRFSCRVRLQPGQVFSLYRAVIEQALQQALSPWLHEPGATPRFGGRVWRSALVDRVESLDGVDWISDVRLQVDGGPDVAEAVADTPDAILVSAPSHGLEEVGDA